MAKFMTTKEASEKWDISERRINVLCKEGRILGAYKENKRWILPADAVKPADKRLKGDASSSLSEKKVASKSGKKLPLPIGISDYRKASSEYYYVDKTLLIRDFIDERPQVSLFTRPRRFGKTLNMDMLRAQFKFFWLKSLFFRFWNVIGCLCR